MVNFRCTYIYNMKSRNILACFGPGLEQAACQCYEKLLIQLGTDINVATREGSLSVGDKFPDFFNSQTSTTKGE